MTTLTVTFRHSPANRANFDSIIGERYDAMMTISAIIPTHPGRMKNGLYARAIRSVAGQTLLPDAIHTAVDTEKLGAAATRNRALQAAATEWVAFLDSDDIWKPIHLEHMMRHAIQTGADFVYSWFELLDARGTNWGDVDPIFPPTHFSNPFDPADPIETTITTLVRTDLAKDIGFKELDRGHDINSGEDRYFALEAVRLGAQIEHLVERTWIWAHHMGNTSGKPHRGDAIL